MKYKVLFSYSNTKIDFLRRFRNFSTYRAKLQLKKKTTNFNKNMLKNKELKKEVKTYSKKPANVSKNMWYDRRNSRQFLNIIGETKEFESRVKK